MGISQATSAIMVFLTGLLPASCHKTTAVAQPTTPPAATIAATQPVAVKTNQRNLGELVLTNKSDFFIQFDNGEFCTLTPRMLDQNSVRITLSVETKNAYGETSNFTIKQLVTQPGKSVEVAVGDLNLTFTPNIVSAD